MNSITIRPTIHDYSELQSIRQRLFEIPTMAENARASRIASQLDPITAAGHPDAFIRAKHFDRKQQRPLIIIHYTHEARFTSYKSHLNRIWGQHFSRATMIDARLIVGTRNNTNLAIQLNVSDQRRSLNRTTSLSNEDPPHT